MLQMWSIFNPLESHMNAELKENVRAILGRWTMADLMEVIVENVGYDGALYELAEGIRQRAEAMDEGDLVEDYVEDIEHVASMMEEAFA